MKNSWFYEHLHPNLRAGYKFKKLIYSGSSAFQKMKIIDTHSYGRALILDDVVQTTESDEFIYHEMMSHVPLFSHPAPKNVLIIGGGDGGVLREVLSHPVKKATMVEIDARVVDLCAKYLPSISGNAFKDRRANLVFADGAKFIRNSGEKYDVIIVDSSDPIGPAKILFQKKFYRDALNILSPGGIMVRQTGSTFLQKDEIRYSYDMYRKVFRHHALYLAPVPTYVGGFFSFMFGSNKVNPKKITLSAINKRYRALKLKTKYYNPQLHLASFAIPNHEKKTIGEKT